MRKRRVLRLVSEKGRARRFAVVILSYSMRRVSLTHDDTRTHAGSESLTSTAADRALWET